MPEQTGIGRTFQIQHDAALVEVGQQEKQTFFRIRIILEKRRHAAAAFAPRRLDLDDVGAEIAQQARAKRAGDALAEIQDPQIVEGCR